MASNVVAGEHDTTPKTFKKCDETAFGRRLRSLSTRREASGPKWKSPYTLQGPETGSGNASWTFRLQSSLYPQVKFNLQLDALIQNGSLRLRVDEADSPTGFTRYSQVAALTLVEEPIPVSGANEFVCVTEGGVTSIEIWNGNVLRVQHSPFLLTVKRQNGVEAFRVNDRGLFHVEHFRNQTDLQPDEVKWFEGEIDQTSWKEDFREHTFISQKGPQGFSFDVSFPGSQNVYGLAEHAAPLSLPSTDGSSFHDPYRIYNIDYNNYPAHAPVGIYGNVPLLQSHTVGSSVGVLAMMGSEGYVDVKHEKSGVQTHWFGESGVMDVFLMLGPTPDALFSQYASLTGYTPLPPLFSLGHHQCRWNYEDEEDVLSVVSNFDKANIPLDVIWLDIEWAQDKRYFEWHKENFATPKDMLAKLDETGRKASPPMLLTIRLVKRLLTDDLLQLVVIVDPHLANKSDYSVFQAAKDRKLLVMAPDGSEEYIGHCWPGASGWVDYTNADAVEWWGSLFGYQHFKESAPNLWLWNDMNEPAVFGAPEKTFPKDCLHYGGVEHRDVHNLYGMLMQKATFQGLTVRDSPGKRPFVLARSFFAGSQRYGAIWTGDNLGDWAHLAGEAAMLLNCGVSGLNFAGADVGGFFGNPDHEMLVRWYQAGAFMPFFRAHANKGTKRREPYLYPDNIQSMLKKAVEMRYRLLPTWYTAFRETEVTGLPVMRPHFVAHPEDTAGFAIGDQYYVGSSGLLFHPVVEPGATEVKVYLAPGQPYYNFITHEAYGAEERGREVLIATPLDEVALVQRGGTIVSTHDDRGDCRSSENTMKLDITLYISLGVDGTASGQIYLDDGESMSYRDGGFVYRSVVFDGGKLHNSDASQSSAKGQSSAVISKIILREISEEGQGKIVTKSGLNLPVAAEWKYSLV